MDKDRKKVSQELSAALAGYCAVGDYLTKHWLGISYTPGVSYLVDKANANWLLDIIASLQPTLCKHPTLQDQFWTLTVSKKSRIPSPGLRSAVITCRGDNDVEIFQKKIEFTDFPLDKIDLVVTNKMLRLSTER